MTLQLLAANPVLRLASIASNLYAAGVERIYLGENVALRTWKRASPVALPFLTLEPHPVLGHDCDLALLDVLARRAPWEHQQRVANAYGISVPDDVVLYRVSSYALYTKTPFLNARYADARKNGWRFRNRADSGFFEVDSMQRSWHARSGFGEREYGRLSELPKRASNHYK